MLGSVQGGLQGQARAATEPSGNVIIASPRPFFVPLNGQGPALSGERVAWTATLGEGPTGSAIDRIYAYDMRARRLGIAVHTGYGASGLIGSYALVGDQLAYVDTQVAPGGIVAWRVAIADLRHNDTAIITSSPRGATSTIPPQIAYDGTHLLVLQTVSVGMATIESTALLYTPAQRRWQVLQQVRNLSFGDPVLAGATALWTIQAFAPRVSSRLTAYDMGRRTLRVLPVGDVSQVEASGDLAVWKSGVTGAPGYLTLYSLRTNRILSSDLAHSNTAVFPSIAGPLVSWTDASGASVHIYNVAARRVIYNAPAARGQVYGLTSTTGSAVSWVYTVLAHGKSTPRGYVVVHGVR